MKEKRISSLIVQNNDDKSMGGIIAERDFVKRVCADHKKSSEVKISELMSKIQTFAEPDTPVDVVVQRMINNRIRRLPVIFEGKVIGIITVTDLAKELRRIMLTKGIVELIDLILYFTLYGANCLLLPILNYHALVPIVGDLF